MWPFDDCSFPLRSACRMLNSLLLRLINPTLWNRAHGVSAVSTPRRPPFADVSLVESLAAVLAASSSEAAARHVGGRYRGSVAGGR